MGVGCGGFGVWWAGWEGSGWAGVVGGGWGGGSARAWGGRAPASPPAFATHLVVCSGVPRPFSGWEEARDGLGALEWPSAGAGWERWVDCGGSDGGGRA